jgi:uncharacterized heparinase superfamily protein
MKQVFEIVHRAQSAALAAAKPGAEAGSVDAAARKVITDAGYGPTTDISRTASATAWAWMATSGRTSCAGTPRNSNPT